MSFLMMAAHDTLTSSLTSFVYYLAVNRDWQRKLARGNRVARSDEGRALPYEKLTRCS